MNITQDVITDLLPAYLSGEASADTQALVDEFQREHPQFAAVVQAARRGLGEPLPADQRPLAPDLEREAVRRTRAVISRQRWMMALAIVLTLMPLSFTIGADGIRFLLRDEPRTALFLLPASCLWFVYLRMQRRLKTAGL
jgi:predicted anti-sigma-YlaC factor YlaD